MRIKKEYFLRALFFSLLFFLAGHAFLYSNLSLRGDSLTINAGLMTDHLTAQFQPLAPVYLSIRGNIAAPFVIGMLVFLFLFGAYLLLCQILVVHDSIEAALLAGLLFLSPALLEMNTANLMTVDCICLSFFIMVSGCYVLSSSHLNTIFSVPVAGVLFATGLSLYPNFVSVPVCILILQQICEGNASSCEDSKDNAKRQSVKQKLLFLLLSLAIGLFLFAACCYVFARRVGADLEFGFSFLGGAGFLSGLVYPFLSLFTRCTAYWHVAVVIIALLLLLCLFVLLQRKQPLLLLSLCLLVLFSGLPWFSSEAPQFSLTFIFLPFAVLRIVLSGMKSVHVGKWSFNRVVLLACCVVFVGTIIFTNQVYFATNLDMDTTLSVITRVIARAEQTEGFDVRWTQTAIVGSLDRSPLIAQREGFEHLNELHAMRANSSIPSDSYNTWYLWETLGYPILLISDYERDKLAETPEVLEMHAFPAADSVRMIDGTLVIKLSED